MAERHLPTSSTSWLPWSAKAIARRGRFSSGATASGANGHLLRIHLYGEVRRREIEPRSADFMRFRSDWQRLALAPVAGVRSPHYGGIEQLKVL